MTQAETENPEQQEHLLHQRWKMWCKFQQKKSSVNDTWKDSQTAVHEFETIESFWRLYNNIQTPGSVQQQLDYSLFKADLHPSWEDPNIATGGRWTAKVDKMKPGQIDEMWQNVLLLLIGEHCKVYGKHICGGVVSMKPKSKKISLWINTMEEEPAMALGKALHDLLSETGEDMPVFFEDFSTIDSSVPTGERKKFLYTYPVKVAKV